MAAAMVCGSALAPQAAFAAPHGSGAASARVDEAGTPATATRHADRRAADHRGSRLTLAHELPPPATHNAPPSRAPGAVPRKLARVETGGPTLTASWGTSPILEGVSTFLNISIDRSTTGSPLSGLGYTVTLPTGLYFSNATVYRTSAACSGSGGATVGGTSVVLSSWTINSSYTFCHFSIFVSSVTSGSYPLHSSAFTGLSGVDNGVTDQTLVVNPLPPKLTGTFTPGEITSGAVSSLALHLARTDNNPTSVASGLGLVLALPTGLSVGSGATPNTCGGTLTAVAGTITLTGGSLTGASSCDMTIPVTSSTPASYPLPNSVVTTSTMTVALTLPCGESARRAGTGCTALTLVVHGLAQTVSFTQPQTWSLSKHTVLLDGSASSGLPVAFTSGTTSVCTVSGSTVTLVAAGTCTVNADQAGDSTYGAATRVGRSFTVGPTTGPVTGLTATAGVSSVEVHWTAPGSTAGVTGYTVTASPGPATCTTTATTCILGGTAGVTYTYTVITDSPLGDSEAAGPSTAATPTAPVFDNTPPDTSLTLTTGTGLTTVTATPSQDIVVIGTGFAPYSTASIVIYSSPTTLGTATTDSTGAFTRSVTIPASLAGGNHTVFASGVDTHGAPHSLKLTVTVAVAAAAHGASTSSLAVTGSDTAVLFLLGLCFTGTGGALLIAGRPRRRVTVA